MAGAGCRSGVPRLVPPASQAGCPGAAVNSQVTRQALCSQGSQTVTQNERPPPGSLLYC